MVFRAIFLIVLFLAGEAAEAAVLKGVIVKNEIGGPPVPNVAISSVTGSNPTVSRSNGTFTLEFPMRQPGDTVRLIVQEPGHVVVNDIQLEHTLVADPETRPLIILLCRQGAREEMARRFYRLKTNEAIERNYREKLRKLEEEKKASAAALAKLAKERDRALAAAEQTAEALARTKPGETSALYRKAMRLFLEGKIEQALDLLDDEKLRRLTADAQKRKAEAQQELAQVVDAWLLKGQLLSVSFALMRRKRHTTQR